MPSPINRVPPGLLSLLDVQTQGLNPSLLGDLITPTMELTDFYVNSIARAETGATSAVTGQGSFLLSGNFVCGPGELLVVSSCAAIPTLALPAGESITYAPVVASVALGLPIAQVGPTASAAATQRAISGTITPFIITPGQALGVYVPVVSAASNPTITFFARIARLRV